MWLKEMVEDYYLNYGFEGYFEDYWLNYCSEGCFDSGYFINFDLADYLETFLSQYLAYLKRNHWGFD